MSAGQEKAGLDLNPGSKSPPGVGVIPDKSIGPTPMALAQKDDPVLAYAASLLGANSPLKRHANFTSSPASLKTLTVVKKKTRKTISS
jgi:hypothetical protein